MRTLTRDTARAGAAGDSAAAVTVPLTAVSGAPIHTGRLPARPDPTDGPAFRRVIRAARAVMTAVPPPADGHEVCGRVHRFIARTRTFRPWTGRTATGLPADAAGALPQPSNTPSA